MRSFAFALILFLGTVPVNADWPTIRGNSARTGSTQAELKPPFRLAWACHFENERLGSVVEPIVARGRVFVGTHQGSLYALDAASGKPLWRLHTGGPILHAPAVDGDLLVVADAGGNLFVIEAATGVQRWALATGQSGGFAASPTLADGAVFLGMRQGGFLAYDLKTGRERWGIGLDSIPVRQTAAWHKGRVFFTAEDLKTRCVDGRTGKVLWTSTSHSGQTARDGYPVLLAAGNKRRVVVRTNPVVNMSRRIAEDRRLLGKTAGVDDSHWQKLDSWTKSAKAVGNPDLWEREQSAIVSFLHEHPEAQSFFVLDADTGQDLPPAPVLWAGGCQGVGAAPLLLPDGKALVFYRSAYGNWNLGVAPLVALGEFDLETNRLTPWQHRNGRQPPWNTFWGTADETQNFVVAGETILIVHQSTLSGFDLKTKKLFPIWGERDSWGGFRNLPWARNEWNGPARGGVAVAGNRLYWQTGSRILCLAAGEKGKPPQETTLIDKEVPLKFAGAAPLVEPKRTLAGKLDAAVTEVLSRRWAPLYVEAGLAGREFFFDRSADTFTALAWAYPHLSPKVQKQVKAYLAGQWQDHPPWGQHGRLDVTEGDRREWFPVPRQVLHGSQEGPHSLGRLPALALYAQRCGEWERVLAHWSQLKAIFEDFQRKGWHLRPDKGDLYANRYLAGLLALARVADKANDSEAAQKARDLAEKTGTALEGWWQRTATRTRLAVVPSIREWDEFINQGHGLFFRVIPHRAKLALFHDLTPEIAARVRAKVPEAVDQVWDAFERLCPTWHLQGEERQVHYGENYLDPPDFARDAFFGLAWLRQGTRQQLEDRLDIPFCKADLNYIIKLALIGERFGLRR